MKKIKSLLFLLLALLALPFGGKVLAEEVVGLLECNYIVPDNYVDDVNVYYLHPAPSNMPNYKTITFIYTEVGFHGDGKEHGTVGRVLLKNVNGGFIALNDINEFCVKSEHNTISGTATNSLCAGGDKTMPKSSFTDESNFIEAYKKENNSCPSYFQIIETSEKYMQLYFGEFPAAGMIFPVKMTSWLNRNPDYTTKVMMPITTYGWTLHYPVPEDEKEWEKIPDACLGLNLQLFVEKINNVPTLRAHVFYEKGKGYYENSAKQVQTVMVKTWDTDKNGINNEPYFQLKLLYDLFKTKKFYGYVQGNSGYEQVVYGQTLSGKNECPIKNMAFTNYKCLTHDGAIAALDKAKSDFIAKVAIPLNYIEELANRVGEAESELSEEEIMAKELWLIVEEVEKADLTSEAAGSYLNYTNALNDLANNLCLREPKDLDEVEYQRETGEQLKDGITLQAGILKERVALIRKELENRGYEFTDDENDRLDEFEEDIETFESFANVTDILILGGYDVNLSYKADCAIISNSLHRWLIQLLDLIKIGALILTVILGMIDFFSGLASGNADTMKKVWTKFSRRLIAVVLLFLLPVILEFLLGLINITGLDPTNPLCGLK